MTDRAAPATAGQVAEAIGSRLDGRPLAVLLDVDGTLAPIAARPQDAMVPPETRRAVEALSQAAGVSVAAISGRAAADARRLVGLSGIWVLGNHGMEVLSPEGEITAHPDAVPYEHAIERACAMLTPLEATTRGVIVENKRWTLSLHYRLALDSVVPEVVSKAQEVAQHTGLRVTEGKKLVELRPPVTVNKGTAAVGLLDHIGGFTPSASIFFAGDDNTDEDAFLALRERWPRAVTVRVGSNDGVQTAAEFVLEGPAAFRELLEWLAARVR